MLIPIDRFEDEYAVCELEDGSFADLPRKLFTDAKEGDIFLIEKNEKEASARKEKIKKLSDKLFE